MLARRVSSNAGMTLIEVPIYLLITFVVCLGAFSLINFLQASADQLRLQSKRDLVRDQLVQTLLNEASIRTTSNLEPLLKACLEVGTVTCRAQQEYAISLYDSKGVKVAGPADAPVYYTLNGAPCTPPSPHCKIKVTSSLRAQGLPEMPTEQLMDLPKYNWMYHDFLELKYKISILQDAGTISFRDLSGSVILNPEDFQEEI